MRWVLYYPDGRMIENRPLDDSSISQRLTDRNGNKIVWRPESGGMRIENEVGNYILFSANGVTQQGVNGEPVTTTLVGTNFWVYRNFEVTNSPNAPTHMLNYDLYVNLGGIEKIILPSQVGSREYKFTYNGVEASPSPGNYTDGWGELKSVTLPSGAKADYGYQLDGNTPVLGAFDIISNSVTGRTLTYDVQYDGGSQQVTETTSYGAFGGTGGTCSPSGRCQAHYSSYGGDLSGYTFRIVETGGAVSEKRWVYKRPVSGGGYQKIEPFVKTEYTSVPDANGDPVKTAIKDYEYDQNGNILEIKEYDWVDYNSIPRSSTPMAGETILAPRPTGLPSSGLVLKRRTINTYYNATPNALDAVPNSSNHFSNPSAPKLLNLIKSTEVRDGSNNPVSRTEFYYDGGLSNPSKGNLTETRVWDSYKGGTYQAYSNPLTTANSISTFAEYDQYGNVMRTTDANGVVTQVTYGAVQGPGGPVYDLYPTQTVSAYGTPQARTSAAVYDFYTGLVTSTTDVDNGVTAATEYDALGRPLKAIAAVGTPLEVWTQTEYDDVNRRVVVRSDLETKGDGRKVAIQHYDQLGRVRLARTLENSATEDPYNETHGIKVQARYFTDDPNSYQLTSNPYRAATSTAATNEESMAWTRSKSWNHGRRQEVETFSGAALPAPWGSNSNSTGVVVTESDADRTLVTDQAGKRRISRTNALGQLKEIWEIMEASDPDTVSVTFPNTSIAYGYKTSYSYDTLNNLTAVNQGVQTRSFTYSSLSRLLSATNPESGTINYGFDSNGNLTSKVDARSITTGYAYDALNRVTARTYANEPSGSETPDVTYTYDDPLIANSRGRLTKVSSSLSTTEYTSFDILGRVTRSKQTTDGVVYGDDTNPMTYTYNLSGALVEQKYPSGRVVKNVLDNNGDLSIVQSKKNSGVGYWNYANNFTYTAAGAVSSMQLGNGRWESTAFNSRLQPTQIALGVTQSATNLLKLNYSYGDWNGSSIDATKNNGNILQQVITVPTVGTDNGFTATQKYYYDSLNRIDDATEEIASSQTWQQDFSYDRYGNRNFVEANTTTLPKECTESGNPVVCAAIRPIVNPSVNTDDNRLIGYTFDTAGNTTGDVQGRIFIYDAENKQVEVRDSNITNPPGEPDANLIGRYAYDGDGKRIKKIVPANDEVTVFVYDAGGKLVAEYSTILPQNPKVSYTTNDHLGSPRILTGENGATISRRDFHPFGEEFLTAERTQGLGYTSDDIRQKFTGYQRDGELALDFAQARYYGFLHGKFMSPDRPLMDQSSIDPQSWNLYVYAGNSPIKYTDPLGLWKRVQCEGGSWSCWEAEEGDTYESLAEFLFVDPSNLAEFFQNQEVVEGRVFDVSGYLDWRKQHADADEKLFQDEFYAIGSNPPLLGGVKTIAKSSGFLRWFKKLPGRAGRALGILGPKKAATVADLAAKQLVGSSGGEMIRDAVNIVKAFKGTPQQKAELLEEFTKQITQRTGNTWNAVRSAGADGSAIFSGELGHAIVIKSSGEIFVGNLKNGFSFGQGGVLTPLYDVLKKID